MRNVLFLILNETNKLNEILENLVKSGVRGATIIDSQGMGSALSTGDGQLFGGLLRFAIDNNRPYNKVVFTVCDDEETLDKAIKAIQEILGDMTKPGVGLMFTVPVGQIIGVTDPSHRQ